MFPDPEGLEIRPAIPTDRAAIHHLLTHTPRPPVVSAWPWEEHLGEETFSVAFSQDRLVGALLAHPDAGPVAWARLGALASGVGVGPWLDRSLPPVIKSLRRLGARLLAWTDVGEWAGPALRARGFRRLTRLATMAKETRWLPSVVAPGVRVRPGKPSDVPALTRVDRAAFSPPWWLSAKTLEWLRRESLCFLVAEHADQRSGYVEARLVEHGAHIGRLAVVPHAQGRGVGGLLLAGALSYLWEHGAEQVTLNTQEENHTSQRFYARFGFRPFGRLVAAWGRWL